MQAVLLFAELWHQKGRDDGRKRPDRQGRASMPEGNFFHYDQAAVDHLARKDKKLAAAMQAIGPVRREVMPDLFQALMHAITGQQISMAAQRTVWSSLRAS